CPVWLQSSSIACLPRMTSPGDSFRAIARSSFATASGSISAPVSTRMARSAPSASAVRSVSWLAAVPHDTATISVAAPASFSRIASSTAISSKGFIDILTFAVSTPLPSARTRTFTLKSTTRLTATRTFMGLSAGKPRLYKASPRRDFGRRAPFEPVGEVFRLVARVRARAVDRRRRDVLVAFLVHADRAAVIGDQAPQAAVRSAQLADLVRPNRGREYRGIEAQPAGLRARAHPLEPDVGEPRVGVAAADVGVHAREPALLHHLPDRVLLLLPDRRLERAPALVDRERLVREVDIRGELDVVEAEPRPREHAHRS